MTDPNAKNHDPPHASPPVRAIEGLGARTLAILEDIGAAWTLLAATTAWLWRGLSDRKVRIGRAAVVSQIVRIGVRATSIVCLVAGAVGLILVLQLAPPLDELGQKELIPNILGVAILRELGPLMGAIVLTGFAGAAIAAEIGTMVVGEEIEALTAHALNPIRFLVLPRVCAAIISMAALAVIADIAALLTGFVVAAIAVGVPPATFWTNMLDQVKLVDFLAGVGKSAAYGLLIGLIACTNGLRVIGGAAGVGRATTLTVVQSIVAIVMADLIITTVLYALGLV